MRNEVRTKLRPIVHWDDYKLDPRYFILVFLSLFAILGQVYLGFFSTMGGCIHIHFLYNAYRAFLISLEDRNMVVSIKRFDYRYRSKPAIKLQCVMDLCRHSSNVHFSQICTAI